MNVKTVLIFMILVVTTTGIGLVNADVAVEVSSQEKAEALVNPVPYTAASVQRGKSAFMQSCAGCHDRDGKARSVALAKATDLTNPDSWSYGNSDGEIFKTIRDGAGDNMPPFKYLIMDEQILWHLVNFVHSLRPDARAFEE